VPLFVPRQATFNAFKMYSFIDLCYLQEVRQEDNFFSRDCRNKITFKEASIDLYSYSLALMGENSADIDNEWKSKLSTHPDILSKARISQ
jgi:hypothetical protein